MKKLTNYRALQLCRDIKKDDGNAIEVALQESSRDGSSIKSALFKCANMDGENFKINSGDAIFVEVSANSSLSLP